MKKCLVLGAAGMIGQALEYRLKAEGNFVVSIARKFPPYRKSVADETNILDLTNTADYHAHFWRHEFDEVFQMAGSVGGIGYISNHENDADILTNSLKINLHTLEAMRRAESYARIFFASSQCVYPGHLEVDPFAAERLADRKPGFFREQDAQFGDSAFAQEKLYSEAIYQAYAINYGIDCRIGRLGNTYGPYCCWSDPRAKSVAALCRKVATAGYGEPVEIWGTGEQKRSFTYVDDTVEGILRLMDGPNYQGPVNIAHGELYSIKELFETICQVAGKVLGPRYIDGPTGACERGSDNTLARSLLNWEPPTSLEEGLRKTYPWIRDQAVKATS